MRRGEFLQTVRRVVVKVGSQVVAPAGVLDETVLDDLCDGLLEMRSRGLEVVLVSSGAVAAGYRALGLAERPRGSLSTLRITVSGQRAGQRIDRTLVTHAAERTRGLPSH